MVTKVLSEIVEKYIECEKLDFCYYGVRSHHNNETVVGEVVSHDSFDWNTETELDGVCAIDVFGICNRNTDKGVYDVEEIVEDIIDSVNQYHANGNEIILVASNKMCYGSDRDEIILKGIRLA